MINMLVASALVQAASDGADINAPKIIDLDPALFSGPPYRRLFMDAMVIEESDNLKKAFHSAEKYAGNPVFEKGPEWEGWGPSCGGTVLRHEGNFRMYYYCIANGEKTKVCMAESEDGFHWTRPNLGIVEWKGSKDNNIVDCSTLVTKLAHPESPDKAWLTFTDKRLGYSPDGIHWTWDGPERQLFKTSDTMSLFFDPYHNRVCATWKSHNRRGRAAGVVWSDDLETWVKPVEGPVFVADDQDPDSSQIYAMPTFAYQGMFIGLPWFYNARWYKYGQYSAKYMYEVQEGSPRTIDVQLAWSWDLVNWTRTPERKPFINNPPYNTFDSGLAFTAREPLVMGDELWFYYTGWDQIHEDYDGIDCKVGLAKLRLDGFCSMQAGDEEGWFISRREVFNTPKVTINAKCRPGGYIAAEIVDRYNNPIPGFEKYYSYAFTGDSVRGELTWKTKEFPAELMDKDKKIKFYIKNADLYSYLPVDINMTIDTGMPDATLS